MLISLFLVMSMPSLGLAANPRPEPPGMPRIKQFEAVIKQLDEIQDRLDAVLHPPDPGIVGKLDAMSNQLTGVLKVLNPSPSNGGAEEETLDRIQKQATVIVSTINDYLKQGQPSDNIRLALKNVSAAAQAIVDRCTELLEEIN